MKGSLRDKYNKDSKAVLFWILLTEVTTVSLVIFSVCIDNFAWIFIAAIPAAITWYKQRRFVKNIDNANDGNYEKIK